MGVDWDTYEDVLSVWSRRVVVRCPEMRRTHYGRSFTRQRPHNAARSSRAPSVARGDPRPCRPLQPMETKMNDLLHKVLAAHGSLERWSSFEKANSTIVSG